MREPFGVPGPIDADAMRARLVAGPRLPTSAIVAEPGRPARGYADRPSSEGLSTKTRRTSPQSSPSAGGSASIVSSFRGKSGPTSASKSRPGGEVAPIGRPFKVTDRRPGIVEIRRTARASGSRGGRPNRRLRSSGPVGNLPAGAGRVIVADSIVDSPGRTHSHRPRRRIVCSPMPGPPSGRPGGIQPQGGPGIGLALNPRTHYSRTFRSRRRRDRRAANVRPDRAPVASPSRNVGAGPWPRTPPPGRCENPAVPSTPRRDSVPPPP